MSFFLSLTFSVTVLSGGMIEPIAIVTNNDVKESFEKKGEILILFFYQTTPRNHDAYG